jgi:hypothetical protein
VPNYVEDDKARSDIAATERLLGFPTHGSLEQARLLQWVTEYPQLLQHAWLVQQVLAQLTADVLDTGAVEGLRPAFVGLLMHSLNQGAFGAARDIVLGAMRAVAEAPTFTEAHESLVFDVGFHTHFVGEEGHAAPRLGHPIISLGEVQEYFLAELTPLRRSILSHGDRSSVTWFAHLLQRLSEASIGPIFIAGNVYDILEDGYADGLLEMESIEALACAIRATRHDVDGHPTNEQQDGHADELAAHLALYVVALGGQKQLGRIMGNAGFHPASKMPRRLVMNSGLGEETYRTVARLLGHKSWAPC